MTRTPRDAMTVGGFAPVLAAWTRLPSGRVRQAFGVLRRARALGGSASALDPSSAAAAILGTMLHALDEGTLTARYDAMAAMTLEAPPDTDALDLMPRAPFSAMVGQTASAASSNGYLCLAETLAEGLSRLRDNYATVEMTGVCLRLHGTAPLGLVEVRSAAGEAVYAYSDAGRPVPREGLLREVRISRDVLAGTGFLLSANRVGSRS